MMLFCQGVLILLVVADTGLLLYSDCKRSQKDGPTAGFLAMLVTFVAMLLRIGVLYGAGAMSEVFA